MTGKIRYSGTEKIEKKIYDELDEKIEERLNAISEETRRSVIEEIREELQPETVPYDRLRLIEQRIHEISTTQDGIVREIVDIKTTLNALAAELESMRRGEPVRREPFRDETVKAAAVPAADQSVQSLYDTLAAEQPLPPERSALADPSLSSYNAYSQTAPAQETRRAAQPPGFGGPSGPASPIAPAAFNSGRADGWEYQEYVPAKKNNAEPEKFVPAKTIPARNDPFYFADSEEEILDVSPLREPEPKQEYASPFENIPLTIQKIKPEEQEIPDRSEYIIGSNQKQGRAAPEEDNNANCEYIIAEKDIGSRKFGNRRGSKPTSELKERVVSSDEDDTEIITYE
ncbi:hypothetical protein MmiAt1_00040 [Methanimicrococcus sp. At1]|uniref:Uncharacterized protein n=1 Tax=Methanimicrococcus hacksteinii TaxID=3028293 RepID=A0ABU3VM53_9EURY|nr:hypothetical protein [Methanimicrococcus sp. At1]MDV0444479.1 hypothetical protein [Methanimicrococcus sp. At1]